MGLSAKRGFDILVASVMLAVLWPVMGVVAVLIRWKIGSPVLFRQIRPGLGGEPFELVKFRTMRSGVGDDAERMTPFGALLRATSLDELPELISVLKGDMSLVGPRPLLPEYLELYDERQHRRHEVRPGITGLAQVEGRNNLAWPDRLETDVRYVDSRSFLGDLKILVQTLLVAARRDGVSAAGEATVERFDDWMRKTG